MEKTYQKPTVCVREMQMECALNVGTTVPIGEGTVNPGDAGAKQGAVQWEDYLSEGEE